MCSCKLSAWGSCPTRHHTVVTVLIWANSVLFKGCYIYKSKNFHIHTFQGTLLYLISCGGAFDDCLAGPAFEFTRPNTGESDSASTLGGPAHVCLQCISMQMAVKAGQSPSTNMGQPRYSRHAVQWSTSCTRASDVGSKSEAWCRHFSLIIFKLNLASKRVQMTAICFPVEAGHRGPLHPHACIGMSLTSSFLSSHGSWCRDRGVARTRAVSHANMGRSLLQSWFSSKQYLIFLQAALWHHFVTLLLEGDDDQSHKDVHEEERKDDEIHNVENGHLHAEARIWAPILISCINGMFQHTADEREDSTAEAKWDQTPIQKGRSQHWWLFHRHFDHLMDSRVSVHVGLPYSPKLEAAIYGKTANPIEDGLRHRHREQEGGLSTSTTIAIWMLEEEEEGTGTEVMWASPLKQTLLLFLRRIKDGFIFRRVCYKTGLGMLVHH